ncbi:MAG: DUF1214 domain-containing protein [Parahaliea sp.]
MSLSVTPELNDGQIAYVLNVPPVPVAAFWSVTLYNAAGYLEPNALGTYAVRTCLRSSE